jgi:hypothetical protein
VRRRTFPVSFFDTALAAGTTYTYRVRAVGSAGASAYSNRAQGTTVVFFEPGGSEPAHRCENRGLDHAAMEGQLDE